MAARKKNRKNKLRETGMNPHIKMIEHSIANILAQNPAKTNTISLPSL